MGRFNPTARLPVTWPRDIGQTPIFYASRPSGRPNNPKDHYTSKYLDMPNEPQFPFGHGLSYSRFAIKNLGVDRASFAAGEGVEASVEVINEGSSAGEATIFWFVRDVVASISRPVLELKNVSKIALAPSARGVIRQTIPGSAFAFPGPKLTPIVEPGRFELSAGFSADPSGLLTIDVEATGKLKPRASAEAPSVHAARG